MSSATGLFLLVVMVVASQSSALSRISRQANVDLSNFSDEMLQCLLESDAQGQDGSKCRRLPGNCICVPFWKCRDNLTQPGSDGSLLTVVNVRTNSLTCNTVEEVCCEDVDLNAPPPTAAPLTQLHESICGQRHPDGFGAHFQGFIDRQAQFGEFPWMAAVMTTQTHQDSNANFFICGASLIHPQVVLTAAHYVHDKTADQLMVRLGEWNFKEPSESKAHQDFRVSRIIVHPKYNPATFIYDVALLFLDGVPELGPTVDTICLPQPFEDFSDASCFSSGWGKDSFGLEGAYQQIMKSINLPAFSNNRCQNALRTTRLGQSFRLHDSFMCAGGEGGKDTCTGDGGSPLVCPMPSDPSRYVQVGVVAWGIGCGQEGIPGVYAAVSHAVSWIDQELQSNFGFDVRAQV